MNRAEWLEWRKGGIGSSDAPIIMGVSKWSTPLKLYEEKIYPMVEEEKDSFIMRKGNEFEPRVRSLFELMIGESFDPALCVMEGHEYLRASLDGRSADKKRGAEFKISGREDWNLAKRGVVPAHYYPQVQHQLMVAGLPMAYFVSYLYEPTVTEVTADRLAVVPVLADTNYQTKLLGKEIQFWECVKTRTPPPPAEADYKKMPGIKNLAEGWKETKRRIEDLESRLEGYRQALIIEAIKAGHSKVKCNDLRMCIVTRKGNINYKKVPELAGVNLEPYRGESVTSWKFDIKGDDDETA